MSKTGSSGLGAVVLFVSALAGLIVALYAYCAPLTGVNGTLGALLAIVVCVVIALMALVLMRMRAGRVVWRVLILIALAGNCFAGLLLHEWWLCVAMFVGLIGLVIGLFTRTASPVRAHGSVSS